MECFRLCLLVKPFPVAKRTQNHPDHACSYALVIYSRAPSKPHSQSVQYIPIEEQMKTILTANVYFWNEKTGVHPVCVSENSPVKIKILTDVSISFQLCKKTSHYALINKIADTRPTHNQNWKTQL